MPDVKYTWVSPAQNPARGVVRRFARRTPTTLSGGRPISRRGERFVIAPAGALQGKALASGDGATLNDRLATRVLRRAIAPTLCWLPSARS
jgi:hypothetical protein